MKSLLIVIALLGSVNAIAQVSDRGDDRSAKSGPHSAAATISFPRGGFSLGASYEFMAQDSMGYEGHIRMFNKETDATKRSDGIIIVGVGGAHHFYKKSWDLAFTPSLNIVNIDSATPGGKDATVFGPGVAVALLCQMTPNVAMGFDWQNYWVWFDDIYSGKRIDDLGLKLRLSF